MSAAFESGRLHASLSSQFPWRSSTCGVVLLLCSPRSRRTRLGLSRVDVVLALEELYQHGSKNLRGYIVRLPFQRATLRVGQAWAAACAALCMNAGLAPPSMTSVGAVREASRAVRTEPSPIMASS